MSLDVYLYGQPCAHCGRGGERLFEANITHNLNKMADAACLYYVLWRPDEIGVKTARDLVQSLEIGLELLRTEPARFKMLSPSNGWGSYEGLVNFVAAYLEACKAHPDATVKVSR